MKLEIEDVTKHFGGVNALGGISFDADDQTVTTVLGPNGAGKTTLFNVITGVFYPTAGDVRVDGESITGWPSHAIARKGVARTFQNLRLFNNLDAAGNIRVAVHSMGSCGWLKAVLGLRQYREEVDAAQSRALELLDLVGLAGRHHVRPGALPHGEQRLVEIARALALDPKIILLDEPMAGLNDAECEAVAQVVTKLRAAEITVVMIEHHVDAALRIADHAIVIDFGRKIFDGTPAECRLDPTVRKAYLGDAELEGA